MGLSKTSFLHNGPLDNSMIMGGRVVRCKIRTQYSRSAPFLFPPTRSCVRVSSYEPLQASKEIQETIFIIVIVPWVRGSQIFHMQDIWVDQCLKRFVQAKRVFNAKLLSEAHCDPSPGVFVKFQSSKFGFQLGSIKASWANWVPFYTTHHGLSSVSCGRMARLQRSKSCGISSFQDRRLAMEMGRTGREWIVKFLDWPQLIISHTKPSLPKQEPPNASRLKAFFHLKAHDGVMAVVVIL